MKTEKSASLLKAISKFLRSEQAAEVTELAIVLSLIVAISIALIASIGTKTKTSYSSLNSALPN